MLRGAEGAISAVGLLVATLAVACSFPTYVYPVEDQTFPTEDSGSDASIVEVGPDTAPGETCPDPNGCGGCNDKGVAGARCGETCGQWTCSGTSVVCTLAMPAPGAKCGSCMTSVYSCTSVGTSTCAKPDDRTVYDDVHFDTKDTQLFTLDHTTEIVATYDVTRPVAYVEASFAVKRVPYVCAHVATTPHPDPACTACVAAAGGGFDCTVPKPTTAPVKLTLYEGTPASGLTPIASTTVDAVSLPTAPNLQSFVFAMEVPAKSIGSMLSVGLTTTSTADAVEIYGGGTTSVPAAPAKMTWYHRTVVPTTGAFLEEPATDTALVVRGKACAP